MKTVTKSKEKVDADEIERHIADDRRRHMRRGYVAVIFVTILGATAAMIATEGNVAFESFKGGPFALLASAITAAFINSEHDIFYRYSSTLRMED